jgi:hypothetical protein
MLQIDHKIYYTLRFAAAMCFIGHGAFGVITKPLWCNYFALAGIGHDMAYHLMPLVGTVDILMGISLLIYPTRAIVLWLIIWGTVTALCRPLSGEPFAEFVERAGNYGVPLALLTLCGSGGKTVKGWFGCISPDTLTNEKLLARATNCLKVVVFLLLLGHGWLNMIEKQGLIGQYSLLGFSNPVQAAHLIGILEIAAACLVLIRPLRSVLLLLLVWKMGSELFYPHWELFEWIERGGSYGALLALYFILPGTSVQIRNTSFSTLLNLKINQLNKS